MSCAVGRFPSEQLFAAVLIAGGLVGCPSPPAQAPERSALQRALSVEAPREQGARTWSSLLGPHGEPHFVARGVSEEPMPARDSSQRPRSLVRRGLERWFVDEVVRHQTPAGEHWVQPQEPLVGLQLVGLDLIGVTSAGLVAWEASSLRPTWSLQRARFDEAAGYLVDPRQNPAGCFDGELLWTVDTSTQLVGLEPDSGAVRRRLALPEGQLGRFDCLPGRVLVAVRGADGLGVTAVKTTDGSSLPLFGGAKRLVSLVPLRGRSGQGELVLAVTTDTEEGVRLLLLGERAEVLEVPGISGARFTGRVLAAQLQDSLLLSSGGAVEVYSLQQRRVLGTLVAEAQDLIAEGDSVVLVMPQVSYRLHLAEHAAAEPASLGLVRGDCEEVPGEELRPGALAPTVVCRGGWQLELRFAHPTALPAFTLDSRGHGEYGPALGLNVELASIDEDGDWRLSYALIDRGAGRYEVGTLVAPSQPPLLRLGQRYLLSGQCDSTRYPRGCRLVVQIP